MSGKDFYQSASYRAKQSELTKLRWEKGLHDFLRKKTTKSCERSSCKNVFRVIPSDPKIYCSRRCAAMVNNLGRQQSQITRSKIRAALSGRKYPNRVITNRLKSPPKYKICTNPHCRKKFMLRFWRPASNPIKYCSRDCAIKDIGGRPTSPRAARAKAGIRDDISPTIYFFSRWEANYARILNYRDVQWIHQPKTFQLKTQRYTPDFYLPEIDTYVEIENYLSDYSRNRDEQFRELYPRLKLTLILKEGYLALQKQYSPKLKEWEFS